VAVIRAALALAVIGAVAIAGGVAMLLPAAGVITLGAEAILGSYLLAYFGARGTKR
jgi:hypothetical protein